MNKFMRRAPTIGAILFLVVQITGLAEYMARVLGIRDYRADIFALTLEGMIFVAFYWTRQSVTVADKEGDKSKLSAMQKRDRGARWSALAVGIVLMVASGVFNTLKTMTDFSGQMHSLDWYGALLAGISPTAFAALLGVMQGFVDRLPTPPAKHATDTLPMQAYALVIKALALVDAKLSTPSAHDAPADTVKCKRCGQAVENKPGMMGAHARFNCPKKQKK